MSGELITTEGQYEWDSPDGTALLMGFGTQIRVLTVTGILNQPEYKTHDTEYEGQHGGTYSGPDYMGIRKIQMALAVEDGTIPIETLLDTIQTAFSPTDLEGVLAMKRRNKNKRQVWGKVSRAPDFDGDWDVQRGLAKGAVEIRCADPRVYESTLLLGTTQSAQLTGGRIYPRTYPDVYGSTTIQGTITAVNAGNMDSPPIVRIYGPVDVPQLLHVARGQTLKLNLSLIAGDVIEINIRDHTIVLNGTAVRRNALDPTSRWWTLDPSPASNDIRFLSNAGAGAHIEMDWRTAWKTG